MIWRWMIAKCVWDEKTKLGHGQYRIYQSWDSKREQSMHAITWPLIHWDIQTDRQLLERGGPLPNVWWQSKLSLSTKMHLYIALVKSVLLYGAETWTILKCDEHVVIRISLHNDNKNNNNDNTFVQPVLIT